MACQLREIEGLNMHKYTKLALLAGLVCAVLMALNLPLAGAQSTGADQDIPGGGHFYTQANGGAGAQYGYRITDEGGIGFWSEFQRLGGVNALGYPVSTRFQLDGFIVQATQKVIMQWRSDVSPPQAYFVNVFDKLHDQGKDNILQQTYQIPPQLDPSFDAGKSPQQVQDARLALLNGDAAISGRYGSGPPAILYNGLPTSQITNEGPFSAVRAQRVAIQHWSAANPAAGIKAGDVTVVNGGDIAKALGVVPASAASPETITGVQLATPTPVATATPTVAPFMYRSKEVTDPPVDCNNDPTVNSVPCMATAPNQGTQYIKGRVMDAQARRLQFINVQATVVGATCQNTAGVSGPCVTQVQSAGDGTFTFLIAGSGSTTGSCPPYPLTYQVMVVDNTGAQASDVRTITYSGDCTKAGEFHFDFVKVR
jgi:hypothetical protein